MGKKAEMIKDNKLKGVQNLMQDVFHKPSQLLPLQRLMEEFLNLTGPSHPKALALGLVHSANA